MAVFSYCWWMATSVMSAQFNLDHSESRWFHDRLLDYDCVYYYVPARSGVTLRKTLKTRQIIPYCRRSIETSEATYGEEAFSIHNDHLTFEELVARNITSEQLLSWSATIDLAENYEMFLSTPSKTESSQRFYNCSWLWFGSHCQYSFYFVEEATLADIVRFTYLSKERLIAPSNFPCYIHLKCFTDSTSICLDWREICDGQAACPNGQDEVHCELLEITECATNEYRCRDGSHCIPEDFFQDSALIPDCLDGSDEHTVFTMMSCFHDPGFWCEEYACRYGHLNFECGDGSCVKPLKICDNGRSSLLAPNTNLSVIVNKGLVNSSLHHLYQCRNSKKYISKHRLVDGIADCPEEDDETSNGSCTINSKYRFKCPNEDKCLAPLLLHNNVNDCEDRADEASVESITAKHAIIFQTICDGFVDLIPMIIDGREESDESECDEWQCDNIYTHCNRYWNCPNGADEMNCNEMLPSCSASQHWCVLLNTFRLTCSPLSNMNNGHVDCLGATDERQICRTLYPKTDENHYRFLCPNESRCVSIYELCNGKFDCLQGADEKFCSKQSDVRRWECDPFREDFHSYEERFLCALSDNGRMVPRHFATINIRVYPINISFLLVRRTELDEQPSSTQEESSFANDVLHSLPWQWYCNRGLRLLLFSEAQPYKIECLCSPSYYGDRCQYQNERVSVIVQPKAYLADLHTIFAIVLELVDAYGRIQSQEQFTYLSLRDCQTKFHVYLLYGSRPKDPTTNYSVRIHVFNRQALEYRASWLFDLPFSFLPVHRLAVEILIPTGRSQSRAVGCEHGEYLLDENLGRSFCRCYSGWSGLKCSFKHQCHCAAHSICVSPSICVCPPGKRGSRCYLSGISCPRNACENGGRCIPADEHWPEQDFFCICSEGYSGHRCEIVETKILLTFRHILIPLYMIVHLIIFPDDQFSPERTTIFIKIKVDEQFVTINTALKFHLVLAELHESYYLIVALKRRIQLASIPTEINPSRRCASLTELFNETFTHLHLLRRIKSYHLPCQQQSELVCFYDDAHICLCDIDHRVNCFLFNHTMTYNCQEYSSCENNGECFQDKPTCPSSSVCRCGDCFFGEKCQFSSKGLISSLDAILGSHVKANISLTKQSDLIKVSLAITVIMTAFGIASGFLCCLTFQSETAREVGCGLYLLTASLLSIFTMIMFALKFTFLLYSQMTPAINRSFLFSQCMLVDFVLRSCFSLCNWITACVAIERAITVILGIRFAKVKSKIFAKVILLILIVIIPSTIIHDPLHRHLIDDDDNVEKRTWCIVRYSNTLRTFDMIIFFVHFLIPFLINIMSALIIITSITRTAAKTHPRQTYKQHLYRRLRQHKHLIISPIAIFFLSLPYLILLLFSNCMNSTRDPRVFLTGYFASFVPSLLTFFVFVLPSNVYKKEFQEILHQLTHCQLRNSLQL